VWCLLAVALFAWNGWLASLASPFVMVHRYDDVQYQLLARNRLYGHTELGDLAHTVRSEGRHPMWRPGLVWIEEGLARCLDSVRLGAAGASALGTTLLELLLLVAGWCCYGRKTFLFLLIALPAPIIGSQLVPLAVGQAPEVWAAACILGGLTLLIEAVRRRSWQGALLAGVVAGLAEWFRTGNLLLFAAPCALYGLVSLWRRDGRLVALQAAAFAAFVLTAVSGGLTAPSAINKTVANLAANLAERGGPLASDDLPDRGWLFYSMAGYTLVPETLETLNDFLIRTSAGQSLEAFVEAHGQELGENYFLGLKQALRTGFAGLRGRVSDGVLLLFALELLFCAVGRGPLRVPTFVFATGGLAHYLGPVILLAGDDRSHYLMVAYPLFVLVAVRGVVRLFEVVRERSGQQSPESETPQFRPRIMRIAVAVLFACLSVPFYRGQVNQLRAYQQQAEEAQAAVDALDLRGRTVACRNMCWFVDRAVTTILLPYAAVPDLEAYARARKIDGILIWEKEPMAFFRATPYSSPAEFDKAMRASSLFGPPQESGAWRWYPVRTPLDAEKSS
jgi:hypothetical protein